MVLKLREDEAVLRTHHQWEGFVELEEAWRSQVDYDCVEPILLATERCLEMPVGQTRRELLLSARRNLSQWMTSPSPEKDGAQQERVVALLAEVDVAVGNPLSAAEQLRKNALATDLWAHLERGTLPPFPWGGSSSLYEAPEPHNPLITYTQIALGMALVEEQLDHFEHSLALLLHIRDTVQLAAERLGRATLLKVLPFWSRVLDHAFLLTPLVMSRSSLAPGKTLDIFRSLLSLPFALHSDSRHHLLLVFGKFLLYQIAEEDYSLNFFHRNRPTEGGSESSHRLPESLEEEAVMVLMLLERELHPHSREAFPKKMAYGLLTDALLRVSEKGRLRQLLEDSLCVCFSETTHMIFRCALALQLECRYTNCLHMLEEYRNTLLNYKLPSPSRNKQLVLTDLLACKIYLNDLEKVELAWDHLQRVQKVGPPPHLHTSAAYAEALCTWQSAEICFGDFDTQKKLRVTAISFLDDLIKVQPNNRRFLMTQCFFHASNRNLSTAFSLCRQVLERQGSLLGGADPSAYQLFVLLLTSLRRIKDAKRVCNSALSENPRHLSLYFLKSFLQSPAKALSTLRGLLEILATACMEAQEKLAFGASHHGSVSGNHRKDSYPECHESTPIWQGCSDGITLRTPKERHQIAKFFSVLCTRFLELGSFEDAQTCAKEMQELAPHSSESSFVMGKILAHQGRDLEALSAFESSCSRPYVHHAEAHVEAALLLYTRLDRLQLAKNHLSHAVRSHVFNHQAWYHLGVVLKRLGHNQDAASSFLMAIQLEESAPCCPLRLLCPQSL